MNQLSLELVSAVYDCARIASIKVHHLDDEKFHNFSLALRGFESFLGESVKDDFWRKFLRPLKRYRFDLSSTPLPFYYQSRECPSMAERLRGQLVNCDLSYPMFADYARDLVDRVQVLCGHHPNPIQSACAKIIGQGGPDVAILIKEPRLIPAVESSLSDDPMIGEVEVIGPRQLTGHTCYSRLIVVGPARWYGDYVFQSPRARDIHVLRYRWINDISPSNSVFVGSPQNSGVEWTRGSEITGIGTNEDSALLGSSLTPEDLLPSIDWDDISRTVSGRSKGDCDNEEEDEEYVFAQLFELEGGLVVPLDAAESARSTVLVLDDEETDPIRSMRVANIQPGMFLLVRTGGGGDYIVDVANRLLGASAIRVREDQRVWKDHLRRKVRQDGIHDVILDLKSYGSTRANHVNVRNWMSNRSIKTEDPRDFQAVMRLIGLADRFDNYWKNMTIIRSAHSSAGHQIRKQLMTEVRNTDLRDLEKLGRMDFELVGAEGARLSVVRIQSIHPQSVEIHASRLGNQFEMDRNTWLG